MVLSMIKGTITEPSYQLDLTSMVKDQDKILEKVNEKLGSEVGLKVGDLLKRFF